MFKITARCLKSAIHFNSSSVIEKSSFPSRLLKDANSISSIYVSSSHSIQTESSTPSEVIKIYDGALIGKVTFTRVFSLSSSGLSLLAQPVIYQKCMEDSYHMAVIGGLYTLISLFTFGIPLALHQMTKKYVLWIDYNPEKDDYTAYTYSFFMRRTPLNFKAEDVSVITAPFANHQIKGRPLLISPPGFNDISHYKRMRGFDKEMDFIGEEDSAPHNKDRPSKRPDFPSLNEAKQTHVKPSKEEEDPSLPINLRKKG